MQMKYITDVMYSNIVFALVLINRAKAEVIYSNNTPFSDKHHKCYVFPTLEGFCLLFG